MSWGDADVQARAFSVSAFHYSAADADANRVAWAASDPDPFVRAAAMGSEFATPETVARAVVDDPRFMVRVAAVGSQNITQEAAAEGWAKCSDPQFRIAAMDGGGRTEQLADEALKDPNDRVRVSVFEDGQTGPASATAAQVASGAADDDYRVAAAAFQHPAATAELAEEVFLNGASQDHKLAALESHAATEAMAEAGMRQGNRFKYAALEGGGATDSLAKEGLKSKSVEVRKAAVAGPGPTPETLADVVRTHRDHWTVHTALSNPRTPASALRETISGDNNDHWQQAARKNLIGRGEPLIAD